MFISIPALIIFIFIFVPGIWQAIITLIIMPFYGIILLLECLAPSIVRLSRLLTKDVTTPIVIATKSKAYRLGKIVVKLFKPIPK